MVATALLVGAVAAVAVPTFLGLRRRRARERRLAREAAIAASGRPEWEPRLLAERVRSSFAEEISRRGGDPASASLGPVEIVRIWADEGGEGFTAWVAFLARLPRPGGAAARRPRRRAELWRLRLDGVVVGHAPASRDAEDLRARPTPP